MKAQLVVVLATGSHLKSLSLMQNITSQPPQCASWDFDLDRMCSILVVLLYHQLYL